MGNILIITGPTAVGKTDISEYIAQKVNGEILNIDMGQLYEGLSIGTAKPDLGQVKIPHHLFGIIKEPRDCSVLEYRELALQKVDELWKANKTPVFVGGSVFYIKSLLYKLERPVKVEKAKEQSIQYSWEKLAQIDPKRAQEIHFNDKYRIEKALDLYYNYNVMPSLLVPKIDPFFSSLMVFIFEREKAELNQRINLRVEQMLNLGWQEEVAGLSNEWREFLLDKKIIGYDDIINSENNLKEVICQKTRQYAKRQRTALSWIEKSLFEEQKKGLNIELARINLSDQNLYLYIDEVLAKIKWH